MVIANGGWTPAAEWEWPRPLPSAGFISSGQKSYESVNAQVRGLFQVSSVPKKSP